MGEYRVILDTIVDRRIRLQGGDHLVFLRFDDLVHLRNWRSVIRLVSRWPEHHFLIRDRALSHIQLRVSALPGNKGQWSGDPTLLVDVRRKYWIALVR